MPFIRGRYHINSSAGQAIEAAREAEEALLALQHAARGGEEGDDFADNPGANQGSGGPIHRVEIESAQVVPAQSGRAERGFVARIHRGPGGDGSDGFESSTGSRTSHMQGAGRPETHVFSDHGDLVSFLRDEFAKDLNRGA